VACGEVALGEAVAQRGAAMVRFWDG